MDLLERIVDYVTENGLSDLPLRPLAEAVGSSPRVLLYYSVWAPARLLARARSSGSAYPRTASTCCTVPFVFCVYETNVTHHVTGIVANLVYLALIPAVLAIAYGWYRLLERPFMSSRLRPAVEAVPETLPSSLITMPDPSWRGQRGGSKKGCGFYAAAGCYVHE